MPSEMLLQVNRKLSAGGPDLTAEEAEWLRGRLDRLHVQVEGLQEGERASITPIDDENDSWITIRQAPVSRE